MDELMNQQTQGGHSAEETYSAIRGYIITAQNKIVSSVNTAMEKCFKSVQSVRQLEKQIHTTLYQRLLDIQDKISVATKIQTIEPKLEYKKVIKDPYLDFLDISIE